jgi:hypothetical protein
MTEGTVEDLLKVGDRFAEIEKPIKQQWNLSLSTKVPLHIGIPAGETAAVDSAHHRKEGRYFSITCRGKTGRGSSSAKSNLLQKRRLFQKLLKSHPQ